MWFVLILLVAIMLVMAATSGAGFWLVTGLGVLVFWVIGGTEAASGIAFGMACMLLLLVAHGNTAATDTLENFLASAGRWLTGRRKK